MISGAVAGLGTITPASGYVAPWHGLVIGVIAGALCFWACTSLKQRLNYDDSLDVFGVHGVGGLTGTMLAGVFATAAIGGTAGWIEGNPQQLLTQLYGVAVTLVWSGVVTFVLLKLVGLFTPLRTSPAAGARGSRHHPARRGAAVGAVARGPPIDGPATGYRTSALRLGTIVAANWPARETGRSD